MSIGKAAAPHSADAAVTPAGRASHRWMQETEIAALRPLLAQFVAHVAGAFADCRCTIQLFEKPDTLRTVVASDMPLGDLGQTSFPLGVGVAGWVAQMGVPVLVHDVTKEPRFLSLRRETVGTIMCVPITDATHCYGTMTAWAPRVGAFHRGTLATLRAYAQGAALAVAQAHRAMAQEAAAHRATTLLALTRAVAACEDPRLAPELVLPLICDVVPYTVGVLVTEGADRQPETQLFTRTLQTVGQRERLRRWALDAWAIQRGHGARFAPMTDIVGGQMVYAVPLRAAGSLVGLICYFHAAPFGPDAQQRLEDCSYVIGTAVYNAAIFRQMLIGKERFEAVFAYTIDGFLLLDAAGTTALDANRAFYHLTKIAPEDAGMPLPITALEEHWAASARAVESADPSALRHWLIAPDGARDRDLEVTESAIMIGEAPHRLRVFHDATAIRKVERTRAEFMSVVSHELRNPLASIYGFLSILTEERTGPLTATQRDFLETASLSVQQLWGLVDDINDLVQADLGRLELRREPVDIAAIVRAVIETAVPILESARLTVQTAIAAPLPLALADPARVRRVLANLLSNAIKFSEPATTIIVQAIAEDGMIRVSVRDTGPGIPPQDAERIFERFVKGTNIPQQDASGLGLGLAVVRQLVGAHSGRVWVERAPDTGSIFAFTLPVAPLDDR